MRTLNDLSLKDNEREAIREATRMLKEKFPVKEIIPVSYTHLTLPTNREV